jgi:hypothetical protein
MSARDTAETTASRPAPSGPRWLVAAVAILFGLLFAYDLIEAITNLVGVPAELSSRNDFREANDLAPLVVPWGLLWANAILPVVVFVLAWWLGRRRRPGAQTVIYLVGLAVVAAYTLTFTALV